MKQKNSTSDYITKDFFQKSNTQLIKDIRRETQFTVDTAVEKLERKMQEHNDANLTKLDKIVKELERMREDRTLGDYQAKEVSDQVNNHEKRIKRLEVSQTV